MQEPERKALSRHFNSRSRKVFQDRQQSVVPLKYDSKGSVLTAENFDARKHLKRLTLRDWQFLECWRRNEWALARTCQELGLPEEYGRRMVKKLDAFRQEEARDRALASIPSSNWIQARHLENVVKAETLDEGQRDSLKELAKIQGAYKQVGPTTQVNVFNLPKLSPEIEAQFKDLAEKALEAEQVA